MVDIDAAVGFVVSRSDTVERARLSYLRTGARPAEEILVHAERGQTASGGWPAQAGDDVASIDATCFRLAELDDLAGLDRPAAVRALDWLASRQRRSGLWQEDPALADSAPPWAKPGDPEADFYLTTNAAFWLAVSSADPGDAAGGTGPVRYEMPLARAAQTVVDHVRDDGSWPGFLISGWLAAAVLRRTGWLFESARIFLVLRGRVATMSAADTAAMLAALRRVGVPADDELLVAARARLAATQRPDGAWANDDAPALDVHTTLTALRGLR